MGIFYWFVFPLSFLFVRNSKSIFIAFTYAVILLIFMAFRNLDFVGDTLNYQTLFNQSNEFLIEHIEPLYAFLNISIKTLGGNFRCVIFIMSVISVFFMYAALVNSTRYVLLGLFFYFFLTYYFYSFNAMRQMAAISVLCCGYVLLDKRGNKSFLACLGLASIIHYTSIVSIVALWIKKIKKQSFLIVCATTLLSFCLGGFNVTQKALPIIESICPGYLKKDYYVEHLQGSFTPTRFMLSLFFLYVYYVSKAKDSFYVNMFWIGILLFNLFSFNVEAMRIAYTFLIVQVVLYSRETFTANRTCCAVCTMYAFFLYYYMMLNQFGVLAKYNLSL